MLSDRNSRQRNHKIETAWLVKPMLGPVIIDTKVRSQRAFMINTSLLLEPQRCSARVRRGCKPNLQSLPLLSPIACLRVEVTGKAPRAHEVSTGD